MVAMAMPCGIASMHAYCVSGQQLGRWLTPNAMKLWLIFATLVNLRNVACWICFCEGTLIDAYFTLYGYKGAYDWCVLAGGGWSGEEGIDGLCCTFY